ncbi:MAG: L,D-transpeptidase [Smithellaceae bacterium]
MKKIKPSVKINRFSKISLTSFAGLGIILVSSFVRLPGAYATEITALNNIINKSSQILLVTNDCASCITAKIVALEKKDGKWKKKGESFNGVIGKNGFANPGEKREGDGKTPSGIFSLKLTFGYNESIQTKMPYKQTLPDDLWIDDVNAADYNRWVKKSKTRALSFEQMKRDDNLYKYGIVIEYNTNPVIKSHGSAIFLHVWRGENAATAGCVAVSENNIVRILGWLDPQALPLIIMGTENIMERIIITQ